MGEVTKVKMRRIGVVSMAEYMTLIMLIIGLIYAALFSIIGYFIGSTFALPGLVTGMGIIAVIIITPVAFALAGFIMGAFTALIYNLIARLMGGVKLELEEA